MARKMSMTNVCLIVVLALALVYFFRPQTFNFLKQGFMDEGFDGCDDDEVMVNGECVPASSISGFQDMPDCPPGESRNEEGECEKD